MSQLTLEDVKAHCQVLDFDTDDDVLRDLLETAERHVMDFTRRELDVEYPDQWPRPLTQAVKMLVAHWYLTREAGAAAQMEPVPMGVPQLLAAYRDMSR